jgi:hypothetical protein
VVCCRHASNLPANGCVWSDVPPRVSPPSLAPHAAYKSVRFSVQRLQLDDMLPGTPFPVVLAAAPQQPGKQGGQPMLAVTVTSVVGGPRGRSYMPLVAVRRVWLGTGGPGSQRVAT